ncbi:MAG: MBOAT family protein [Clostridia bacterium]|nr:MBOAT family protein [Clostridia bacterium]
MLFSSIPFLFYFLPIVLLLYAISPARLKNTVLLLSGLFFYGWGEPRFLVFMVAAIVQGYVLGLLIERYRSKRISLVFLVLSVAICLGMLGYCKYMDFFIHNFNALTGMSLPLTGIVLPIGISFYTFQILSYTVDVYRGDVKAQRDPIALGAYVAMFPQLIAGPIVRYADIEKQLKERDHSFEKISGGVTRFVIGLAKKILIANPLGELVAIYKDSADASVLFTWVYAIAFLFHIYFDFSGYSDMAIGLGKFFGFEFVENFNYPYISKSITEFWRRWHISLGTWFRDYLYIPLGGNRVGRVRGLFNILVVWMATGFWHGAAWNFVLWGLMFAVLLAVEKTFLLKLLEKIGAFRHVYVMFFVIISFVLFDSVSLGECVSRVGAMFGADGLPFVSREAVYYLISYALVFAAAAIGATPLPAMAVRRLGETRVGGAVLSVARPVFTLGLLVLCTAYLIDGSFNPFLYFRF